MKKEINKITLIIRKYSIEETLAIAEEANKYDCFNLEITTNTDNWQNIIKEVISKKYNNIIVGAGTVLNMDLLKEAIDSGSQFVLAPIKMDKKMLDYCTEKNVVSVPAAFSPSEIYEMYSNGADVVKLFPAVDLPARYIKDIMAPLGQIPIMVVGGINTENISEYFKYGAKYAGIGSGICNREELKAGDKHTLEDNLLKLSKLAKTL